MKSAHLKGSQLGPLVFYPNTMPVWMYMSWPMMNPKDPSVSRCIFGLRKQALKSVSQRIISSFLYVIQRFQMRINYSTRIWLYQRLLEVHPLPRSSSSWEWRTNGSFWYHPKPILVLFQVLAQSPVGHAGLLERTSWARQEGEAHDSFSPLCSWCAEQCRDFGPCSVDYLFGGR